MDTSELNKDALGLPHTNILTQMTPKVKISQINTCPLGKLNKNV